MISKNVGERVRVEFVFEDEDGLLTDPTTVVVKVILPDKTVAVYGSPDVEMVSEGVYALSFNLTLNGNYYVKAFGSGALVAASEDVAIVAYSRFT